MKRILDFVGQELAWSQPHTTQRYFELEAGGETIATLQFRSVFGSFATAETAEGSWTFKRVGFWTPSVTVRTAGSDTEIAVFRNNTWSNGGTLQLADGRQYRASTNFWMTTTEVTTLNEEPLLRFTRIRGTFHMASQVEIRPAAAKLVELLWMVALGWYLIVTMHADGGAAAAAAAAG